MSMNPKTSAMLGLGSVAVIAVLLYSHRGSLGMGAQVLGAAAVLVTGKSAWDAYTVATHPLSSEAAKVAAAS
jgi:hypothetical protein